VQNALAGLACALSLGVDLDPALAGLEKFRAVPGRLEPVEAGQPFSVFVDYAHTADALEAVLTALRPHTSGRLSIVFGCGGDRDRSKRPAMGQVASELADAVWITTDNARSEDPAAIASDIWSGIPVAARDRVRIVLDRAEAIEGAISAANAGDAVLVAGKGHEKTQVFGSRQVPFDDVEEARRCLWSRFGSQALPA
jgi:UDP-N-acetylmuramoyl-L-alanyl-D-glutamate--2,6-diaminopimelate ligase